jgi:hypothetical protein
VNIGRDFFAVQHGETDRQTKKRQGSNWRLVKLLRVAPRTGAAQVKFDSRAVKTLLSSLGVTLVLCVASIAFALDFPALTGRVVDEAKVSVLAARIWRKPTGNLSSDMLACLVAAQNRNPCLLGSIATGLSRRATNRHCAQDEAGAAAVWRGSSRWGRSLRA